MIPDGIVDFASPTRASRGKGGLENVAPGETITVYLEYFNGKVAPAALPGRTLITVLVIRSPGQTRFKHDTPHVERKRMNGRGTNPLLDAGRWLAHPLSLLLGIPQRLSRTNSTRIVVSLSGSATTTPCTWVHPSETRKYLPPTRSRRRSPVYRKR